jgi:uncharacterized protein YheU (UPF0270 family)
MKIPLGELSENALKALIESFVLREGTDYGHRDYDLEVKCKAVRRQVETGEAEIWFDPANQSIDIRPVTEALRSNRLPGLAD